MSKFTRYALSIILIVLIIVVFSPLFISVNNRIFGQAGGIFTSTLDPIFNIVAGLMLSYTFFVPLTFTIFFKKPEKYYAILTFIGVEVFFMLSSISVLMIIIPLALVGWLIGEGIERTYSHFKKK